MACYEWQTRMIRHIRENEWEKLEPTSCQTPDNCRICSYTISCHPLEYFLNGGTFFPTPEHQPFEFTIEAEEAVERLMGKPMTSDDWFTLFLRCRPSISLLKYLYANHKLEPNKSDPYSLLMLFTVFGDNEGVEYLLSPEIGTNINLQNSSTWNTPLLGLLRSLYESIDGDELEPEEEIELIANREERELLENGQLDDYHDRRLGRIRYFLERGADPLLENRDGLSPLKYVQTSLRCSSSHRVKLIHLLEQYV